MLLEEALAEFTLQLEADGRSEHTVAQYRRHVRALARWAAATGHSGHVEALTHHDVARFMTSAVARSRPDGAAKRATSVNALRSSVRTLFAYLHDAGVIPTNPARLLRRARCAPPPPRGMADDDLRRVLAAMAADGSTEARRDHALFALLAGTGIRLGSAVAADVGDVDLDAGVLELRTTKNDAPYRVRLPAHVAAVLRDHIGDRRSGPLFVGRGGRRLSRRHVQRRFALWCERADLHRLSTVHGLRHRFAMRLYRETRDLLAVMGALGHRSIASTVVYARSTPRL